MTTRSSNKQTGVQATAGTTPPVSAGALPGNPPAGTDQGPSATVEAAAATTGNDPGSTGMTTVTDPVAMLFEQARTAVGGVRRGIGDHLLVMAPGATPHVRKPRPNVEHAVLAMASLLRERPALNPTAVPADMEAAVAQVESATRLSDGLKIFQTAVEDTANVRLNTAWKHARDTYHTASRAAQDDKAIAVAIEPVRVLFQRTPARQSAVVKAATATQRAGAATTRASKAHQQAVAAHQRAATVDPVAAVTAAELEQGPARPGAPAAESSPGGGQPTVQGTLPTPTGR